jgi:hypothetical protein
MLRSTLISLLVFGLSGLLACKDDPRPASACDGEQGCACRSDGTCQDDLVCASDVCTPETASGLVFPRGTRGCEVLFVESAGTTISKARFAAGARGTLIREAPRAALSVVAASDAEFATRAVELVYAGPAPSVSSARCVSANGAPIADATVGFQ